MGSKPTWAEEIARERIDILFEEAERQFEERPERANRYVELARRIAMRFNLALPEEYRRSFCGACHSYLKPGANAQVRVEEGVRRTTCGECGEVNRLPYRD